MTHPQQIVASALATLGPVTEANARERFEAVAWWLIDRMAEAPEVRIDSRIVERLNIYLRASAPVVLTTGETPRTDAMGHLAEISRAEWVHLCRELERELAEARSIAAHTHARNLELADQIAGSAPKKDIPVGWKLVPVEPTEAMLDALGDSPWIVECDTKVQGDNMVVTTRREYREQRYVVDGWQAMLKAAPDWFVQSPAPKAGLPAWPPVTCECPEFVASCTKADCPRASASEERKNG